VVRDVAACMLADQPRLERRARELLRRGPVRAGDRRWQRLAADVARSRALRARRQASLPRPALAPALPISAERERLEAAIAAHQVVVVCGETGSGKSTQLPKICLRLGRGAAGMIGHTQPRRIAARSVAARIASELGTQPGAGIGYQVRFADRTGPDTWVKVMTDGILLAEIRADRELRRYDTIIVDEAHERSLNVDFLLGYLRRLLPRRPDLKLTISSATLDPERMSRHFGGAPVVAVGGRTWPVEVRHRSPPEDDGGDYEPALVAAAHELVAECEGDVLVFLPGEREIREAERALRRALPRGIEILPLYGRLSSARQDRVLARHEGRRVVLATNVAETSLTVPGVRAVIDTGLARISRYSYRAKLQRLPVERVSRASAEQRKGRCGRVGPGVCVRLYSREDEAARDAFTEPEIRRTNLAWVILQMRSLGLGAIEEFPFVDPPDRRYVSDGERLLRELGALDARGRLTEVGRRLARMPVDPRIARMIVAADAEDALGEVLIIAAALSIPDPRERGSEAAETTAEHDAGAPRQPRSDFLELVALWDRFRVGSRSLGAGAQRRLCRRLGLSYPRMREWQDVHHQLARCAREVGLRRARAPAGYAAVHRALLAGLLGNVGLRSGEREYTGPRDLRFRISPASVLHGRGTRWVVAAELVETTRVYAHVAARVRPEWIRHAAAHLVKRSCFEPHWNAARGTVDGHERVTLYGLTLVPRRRIRWAGVDRRGAREVFLQRALVEGDYGAEPPAFLVHNRALVAQLRALEDRTRRRDVMVDEAELFRFYDERLPDDVCGRAELERWRARAEREQPRRLLLERARLLREEAPAVGPEDFPDRLEAGGVALDLVYRFAPGADDDGVTAQVPAAALAQLDAAPFEWLVPGWRREKIVACLRSLPKRLRRELVPLPDIAARFARELGPGPGAPGAARGRGLGEALAQWLQMHHGVDVPVDAWRLERIPAHLRMNFRVVDGAGAVLGEGRELEALQRAHAPAARREFERVRAAAPGTVRASGGAGRWVFGDVPGQSTFERDGRRWTGYPALVDEGGAVAMRLVETPEAARALSRAGVRRLIALRLGRELRRLRRALPGRQSMCLVYALLGPSPLPPPGTTAGARGEGVRHADACAELAGDLVDRAIDEAFLGGSAAPGADAIRSAERFEACFEAGRGVLAATVFDLGERIGEILQRYQRVARRRREARSGPAAASLADLDRQLAGLVHRRFVATTPRAALQHLPRYLEGALRRLEKLERAPGRDRERVARVERQQERLEARRRSHRERGIRDPELDAYRWLLEEFRISLFAQELGTTAPVSEKRLEQQWAKVRA